VVAFRGDDGVDVALWLVDDPAEQQRLADALEAAGTLYVADGHHRAAAAAAFVRATGADADTAAARVLTAAIPSDLLRVLPFHRLVRPSVPATAQEVLARLEEAAVTVEALGAPREPDRRGTVTLTVDGRWFHLDLDDLPDDGATSGDVVAQLDVRRLEQQLLPVLTGAGRGGAHVIPVASPAGLQALVEPGAIGVALAAPPIEAMLAVADAHLTMPPKTTYVAPKLRSGLLVAPRGT
jgi:uncharacterized protein (DUF1015 family)